MTMHKKLRLNTVSSLVYEIFLIINGFVVPRLVIGYYGSSVNGLVVSITQFISVISFLELGVGKVVQSSLYKPLVTQNTLLISQIVVSARRFFRRLAKALLAYVIILLFVFPYLSGQHFEWGYTALLLIAMSINLFSQYYFGIVNRLLLIADQRGFIYYISQAASLLLNTIICVLLIRWRWSIQVVKFASSVVFLLNPLFLAWYVNRHYSIDYKITYDKEPICQKWNGMAQHIAYVVLNNTDTVVLTVFVSTTAVSIYSVYHLVVYGVKRLMTSLTNGIEALFGTLWAKQELKELEKTFEWVEWAIHTSVVFLFGCTAVLILPFVQVYTHNVQDADYIQPLFALLITIAHGCHCIRLPYNMMIFAAGHYKQTQHNYIIAAILNIVLSVLAVFKWGLVGVSVGTLVAMLYQTVWMAWYNAEHLLKHPLKLFVKQLCADFCSISIMAFLSRMFVMKNESYLAWLICALQCVAVFFGLILVVNCVFYRGNVITLFRWLKKKFIGGRKK